MYQRKFHRYAFFLVILGIFFIFTFIIIKFFFLSDKKQAYNTVEAFYEYEQAGDFASSWEMFHPYMKERFSKGHYIQDRAHVFLNHFGVDTFQFKIGKQKKIDEWKITKDAESMTGYKMKVILTFKGKYGNFDIHQQVFVTKVEGEWVILWSYLK